MATWKKWTSTVLVNGQPEPNVEVYVYEPGTTNEITVYEDEGVTPITQPILTDSQGRYAFFVDVDTYPEIRLYLEKDGVDFSEANEDLDGVPVPGASAAAGTFLSLSDTPSSYVGRGGDVVLVKTTEDGIETQPWPVTGSTLNFFLSDDAADIGSYYYMYPTESGNGYSELTSPSLSTGDDQLLWSFVTEAGEPGVEVLALGAYTATLFLRKSGNKDVRVYWKLFKRDTGGTETEILQSAVSDYLTTDNSQYLISAYLNEDQTLDPTDRLVLKLYANVSGTGTDVTVTLTMEGDYDSRLTINILSSAFNLDRLSDVTITSPTEDELLAYDSGSGKWINQTANEVGLLAANGSVPLSGDLDVNGHSIERVKSLSSAMYFLSQFTSISDAITAAAGATLILDGGTWTVSSELSIPSNTTLVCVKPTTLRAASDLNGVSCLFKQQTKSYIAIIGNGLLTIDGNRSARSGTGGSNLAFYDCDHIYLQGFRSINSCLDGFYFGENAVTGYNEYVWMQNCIADNSYRCGLAIISAKHMYVRDCVFKNSSGSSNADGVDLEPQNTSEYLWDVHIIDCVTKDNAGDGVSFVGGNTNFDKVRVFFSNILSTGNNRNWFGGYVDGKMPFTYNGLPVYGTAGGDFFIPYREIIPIGTSNVSVTATSWTALNAWTQYRGNFPRIPGCTRQARLYLYVKNSTGTIHVAIAHSTSAIMAEISHSGDWAAVDSGFVDVPDSVPDFDVTFIILGYVSEGTGEIRMPWEQQRVWLGYKLG